MTSTPLDSDPTGLAALQAHVHQCSLSTGAHHRLHCAVEAVGAFVAPRLVSMLVLTWLLALVMMWPFGTP